MSTTSAESNVGIAFALVIGSSLATAVGASVVFLPNVVKLADRRVLAGSLGFSVGVMVYVSIIEIFPKSQTRFEAAGFSANTSYNLATLCFFCGVAIMVVSKPMKYIVKKFSSSSSAIYRLTYTLLFSYNSDSQCLGAQNYRP
jgi:zinc transporter ZupT